MGKGGISTEVVDELSVHFSFGQVQFLFQTLPNMIAFKPSKVHL